MNISDLIEDYTIPKWEDYPEVEGFRVMIRLPGAPKMYALIARAQREEGEEFDFSDISDKYLTDLASVAVADWKGLTVANFLKLIPGRKPKLEVGQGIPLDTEIEFSKANLSNLLNASGPFFIWVLNQIQARNQAAVQEADEVKNS